MLCWLVLESVLHWNMLDGNMPDGMGEREGEKGMAQVVRAITADGSVIACAIDSTDMIAQMEQIHQTSAVVTAALGRLSTAASLMGMMLKGEKHTVTLRIHADGETGSLLAVANSQGDVKAYVNNPVVELPLNAQGKSNVAGAVGRNGTLSVVKDLQGKQPYVGQVSLVSGEIAEDITHYFATSEQIPTVCGLGVLVNPDLTVKAAGGYLVQLLPYAQESCIDILEHNVKGMPSISEMLVSGISPEQICIRLLEGMEPNILDQGHPGYRCDCSRQRVERALISMGTKELTDMHKQSEDVQVQCHFCNRNFVFTKSALASLLKVCTAE